MDSLISAIIDFISARQVNIMVAVMLTFLYLVYQYKDVLVMMIDQPCKNSLQRSGSRSCRSRSRSRSCCKRMYPCDKNCYNGLRPAHLCPYCTHCNIDNRD
ncbi:unnamed protein product [Pieris brassicae]|uniref:Uncharacterized protein n=1 Tax=Pieris brassicae TaxID=7116 RepID=A0A9P0TL57_PIEBR|nr:unnamed protein product [Pieris brassicae]